MSLILIEGCICFLKWKARFDVLLIKFLHDQQHTESHVREKVQGRSFRAVAGPYYMTSPRGSEKDA